MNDSERVLRLEEKVAYLERHVTAQDKVMLELGDAVARLRAELQLQRHRVGNSGGSVDSSESGEISDDRPPHY